MPDFIEPKADEETEKKAENVKAEDLDQLAKAAAYDQLKAAYEKLRKPGDPEFDIRLADFLAMAALKPPDDKMIEFRKKVRENAFSTLSLLEPPDDKVVEFRKKVRGNAFSTLSARDQPSPRLRAVAVSAARTPMSVRALAAEQPDTNSCVPIGVWISNWADLFPWLATGHLNGIDQTAEAENAVKFRMMQQDFLTLSRLYYTAANASLDLRTEPNSQPQDFLQIADSFARQYATLSSGEVEPEEYGEKAVEAVGQLGMPESGIYQMWDRIQFLRNAELGLGVLVDGQSSGLIPATNLNFDFGEGWGEAGKEWNLGARGFRVARSEGRLQFQAVEVKTMRRSRASTSSYL